MASTSGILKDGPEVLISYWYWYWYWYLTMKIGDRIRFVHNNIPMRITRVGVSEDNNGRAKPAVWAASEADLAKEAAGEIDEDWGRPFKALALPYLLSEVVAIEDPKTA